MIFGHIAATDSFDYLLSHRIWKLAFDYLKTVSADTPPGIYKLLGDDVFVNVHGYATLARPDCRFESHRHVLDLQYCIAGGEQIDWQLNTRLRPAGPYEAAKDVQFYEPEPEQSVLHMLPGHFAIFFPSDAHRPKCADGIHPEVFKLVVKIKTAVL